MERSSSNSSVESGGGGAHSRSLLPNASIFRRMPFAQVFLRPITRTKTIRKFLVCASVVCTGCFLICAVLMFPSRPGLWSAYKGSTSRHLQSMARLFHLETETNSELDQHEQQEFHETSTISIRDLQERQIRRKQHIADGCRSLSASGRLLTKNTTLTPRQFHNFVVDESRRIIYCEIPKVACTNWKRVLLVLAGRVNTTEIVRGEDIHGNFSKQFLPRLSTYQLPEIEHRLNTYYKFVFVREPFERLLSAYHNKFTDKHSQFFQTFFGRRIVKRYRQKPTNESLRLGHDVTLREFVTYLLDPMTTKTLPFNEHWRPFYELCHPCFVNYDVVGKYETLNEDADLILDHFGAKGTIKFPVGYKRPVKTSELVASKFANISIADVHRLWDIYFKDFLLYDYPYPSFRFDRSSTSEHEKQSRL